MGAWGTAIDENDTFADVYHHFYEIYNSGCSPEEASKTVQEELEELFSDPDDANDALFALALSQWETKSLGEDTLHKIEGIVTSGSDLGRWDSNGTNKDLVKSRKSALDKFLCKLRKPRASKKRRSRAKFDFKIEKVIELPCPDGNKVFEVNEQFINGKYSQTFAMMSWETGGGGSLFCHYEEGATVKARWIDSQNIEVQIDPTIKYVKKDDWAFFCGDKVDVVYKK